MTNPMLRHPRISLIKTVGAWMGLVMLLAGLATLFAMGRGIPAAHHVLVMRTLTVLEASNAVINEELIQTRHGNHTSYDAMVNASFALKRASHELRVRLHLAGEGALTTAYRHLQQTIHTKLEAVEEYKSINAVFHNSWKYFPQACDAALAALQRHPANPLVQETLQALLRTILLKSMTGHQDGTGHAQALLETLGTLNATLDPEVRSSVETVLLHAHQIMRTVVDVEEAFLEAYQTPMVESLSNLAVHYAQFHEEVDADASFYQRILFFLATFMALGILWFFIRLRHASQTLRETVHSLEFQKFALDQHAIVSIADRSGNILYANERFCRISGYALEELMGKNHRIIHSNTHPRSFFVEMWDTITRGDVWRGDIQNRNKKGDLYWVNSTIVPFLDKTVVPFQYVSIRNDITHRKNLEEDLIHARDAAEMGARSKASFLANMSHEIRTPMNAVIGFSEVVLQDTTLSAETTQHVQTIYRASKSLLGIINDILDVSKLDSGKFTLETVCFHLPNALADILQTIKFRAEEKNLSLTVDYDTRLPSRFMGDPSRLRQVILNLVGNAIKFTEKGGITLSVAPGDLPDRLAFTLADTGIGMSPAQVEKIFDSFSQADTSTARRFGGTGLGTTISKQIIALMGGTICVESEEGRGSAFYFSVCMPEAMVTEGCLYESGVDREETYRAPRLFHILLAEDIEANATLAQWRLGQQGHTLDWARNGLEAWEAFQSKPYDLVLMDVMMPELDGLDATRRIRAAEQETGHHVPILALTASIMREDYDRCLAVGMDNVLAKPIDFKALFAAMEQAVPEGGGRANTHIRIEEDLAVTLDFSPVEGMIEQDKALRTWQDPLLFAKALRSFAADRQKDAEEMARLLVAHPDDNEPARTMAHALKGVAGNLTLHQIAHLGGDIDTALKSGQREVVETLLPDLQRLLAVTVTAIENIRLPEEENATPLKAFDPDVVPPLLEALSSALDELNPDAVEPLLNSLAAYIEETDLSPIRREVNAFDFEAAKEQVARLAMQMEPNPE